MASVAIHVMVAFPTLERSFKMNAKDKAELVIDHLKDKGFTEEDIVAGVMGLLKDMNNWDWGKK
jgi:hypothetical protein